MQTLRAVHRYWSKKAAAAPGHSLLRRLGAEPAPGKHTASNSHDHGGETGADIVSAHLACLLQNPISCCCAQGRCDAALSFRPTDERSGYCGTACLTLTCAPGGSESEDDEGVPFMGKEEELRGGHRRVMQVDEAHDKLYMIRCGGRA